MGTVKHTYIQKRADFPSVLQRAIDDTRRYLASTARPPFDLLLEQLKAMQSWSANGRTPTKEERKRITVGAIVARELEPAATDDLYDYAQRLYELSFYFQLWWGDSEWASMDDNDPRLSFPTD